MRSATFTSASVACVFSAYLETGERVAIKVRRPQIGEKFVADCAALGLVLKSLEFLTILRPGLSHNFLYDFRSMEESAHLLRFQDN